MILLTFLRFFTRKEKILLKLSNTDIESILSCDLRFVSLITAGGSVYRFPVNFLIHEMFRDILKSELKRNK
jgi:hypothetical protein